MKCLTCTNDAAPGSNYCDIHIQDDLRRVLKTFPAPVTWDPPEVSYRAVRRSSRLRNWIVGGALGVLVLSISAAYFVWSISRSDFVTDYEPSQEIRLESALVSKLENITAGECLESKDPKAGPGEIVYDFIASTPGTYLLWFSLEEYEVPGPKYDNYFQIDVNGQVFISPPYPGFPRHYDRLAREVALQQGPNKIKAVLGGKARICNLKLIHERKATIKTVEGVVLVKEAGVVFLHGDVKGRGTLILSPNEAISSTNDAYLLHMDDGKTRYIRTFSAGRAMFGLSPKKTEIGFDILAR